MKIWWQFSDHVIYKLKMLEIMGNNKQKQGYGQYGKFHYVLMLYVWWTYLASNVIGKCQSLPLYPIPRLPGGRWYSGQIQHLVWCSSITGKIFCKGIQYFEGVPIGQGRLQKRTTVWKGKGEDSDTVLTFYQLFKQWKEWRIQAQPSQHLGKW